MHWMHRCAENKCALSKRLKLSPPTSGLRKLSVPDWRTSHREDQTGSATTAVRWEVDDWRITDAVVTQRRRLADSARTGIEAFPRLTPSLENTHDLRHKSRSPPNAGAPEFHDERIFLKFPLQWTLGHTATDQTLECSNATLQLRFKSWSFHFMWQYTGLQQLLMSVRVVRCPVLPFVNGQFEFWRCVWLKNKHFWSQRQNSKWL